MDSEVARKPFIQNVCALYPAGDMLHREHNRYISRTNGNDESGLQDHNQDRRDDIQLELEALRDELFEYRHMLDKLVRERTARLERRVLILKYCNDNLVIRQNKLSQMYHDLLMKYQALEANTPV